MIEYTRRTLAVLPLAVAWQALVAPRLPSQQPPPQLGFQTTSTHGPVN